MIPDFLPGWTTDRLNELARDVREQGRQLDSGIQTQREQAEDIRDIRTVLQGMASAEMVELRRRADFPRRLFYAIGAPLLASVGAALLLIIAGTIHVG